MIQEKIMIVEDDPTIATLLSEYLSQWGFTCHVPSDFSKILEAYQELAPNLILLDISLPHYNGFYWCQEIRKVSEVPIIFLSSASDNMNVITAMNTGADDFISKPFDLPVLVAKIKALLRRSYVFGQQQSDCYYGDYLLHFQDNRIVYSTTVLDLTPNESKVLQCLYENLGKITKRETIIEKLWQSEYFIDSNTLSVNINRLRKKLETIGLERAIQTIKGEGYMMVTPNDI